jgi:probable rRNA maturation factor
VIHIEINPSLPSKPPVEELERAALATLEHEAAHGDLSLVLSDDAQLQELNRKFLEIDAPTDVLSFPASEMDPDTGKRYLGDILISLPRAALQARAAGHVLKAELQLLVVHGVLHLLGHEHESSEGKARMWSAQAEVLEQLGLGTMRIPE